MNNEIDRKINVTAILFLFVQNRQQTHDWTLIGSGANGLGILECGSELNTLNLLQVKINGSDLENLLGPSRIKVYSKYFTSYEFINTMKALFSFRFWFISSFSTAWVHKKWKQREVVSQNSFLITCNSKKCLLTIKT